MIVLTRPIICAFFVAIAFGLSGQTVQLEDLKFQNEFEKEAISSFQTDSNYLAVLLASSGRGTDSRLKSSSQRLKDIYLGLEPEKLKRKSAKKQIKKIFKSVHDEMLQRYKLENQFIEVFETGRYNCVSATAIYALLLEDFDIQYSITQEPEHVYLTAHIDGNTIIMEGTDPQTGYVAITDKFVEAQVNSLIDRKLITEDELISPDAETILDELFPSNSISLAQLLGVQYHNNMVYAYESQKFDEAFDNALKACYFFDHETFQNSLYLSATWFLTNADPDHERYPEALNIYAKMDTGEEHISDVNQLAALGLYNLVEKGDINGARSFRGRVLDKMSVVEVRKQLDFRYAFFMSAHYDRVGKMDSAYHYAKNAMAIDSVNLEGPTVLMSSLFKSVDLRAFDHPADTVAWYYKNYRILRENDVFVSAFMKVLIGSAYEYLSVGDYKSSRKALDQFISYKDKHPDIKMNQVNVGNIFGKVALREFNFSKSKARNTVNQGLKYAPDNYDLKKIKNYLR